jgi:hypothetical protein
MQNQPHPMQPYTQAPPQFAPPMQRRTGSTSCKVWGILLLVLGGIGVIFLAMNIASALGGGLKASSFGFNMSPEAKAELDRMVDVLMQDAVGRWSFWLNMVADVAIVLLSVVAGYLLAIRPRPAGRKLAVARALVVLLALPVYGYESIVAIEQQNRMTAQLQDIQIDDVLKQEKAANPTMSDAEYETRRAEAKRVVESMQPAMEVAGYAGVVVTALFVMVLNGLILFFMTRPAVKDYLETAAEDGEFEIPNYDPSMGLGGRGPPHPGQPSPADQPPNPPEQQIPPV